ncbi:MAG: PilZ domain-containing protein [Acidobacteria bacterium]|nr:PilZ domain-containing protein [Acidobacteriota bacterium]
MLESTDIKAKAQADAERRQAVRICCAGFAECVSIDPNQLFRGEIRNISETGCYISLRVSVNLPPGTYVQLRFRMGRAEYCAQARVVESMRGGIRMRFIATDPEFNERMRQILGAGSSSRQSD